jgi:hypothetical protein
VQSGPAQWTRAKAVDAAAVPFGDQLPQVEVTNVRETQDTVSFDVSPSDWQQSGAKWLTDWFKDPNALDRPIVQGGPAAWPRATAAKASATPFGDPLPAVDVTNVRETQDTVSFDVSQTGVPVLVKTSYYPAWKVSGAKGPYRASPNFMVVIPTAKHVELRFSRTGIDYVGILATLIGIGLLVPLFMWLPRPAFADGHEPDGDDGRADDTERDDAADDGSAAVVDGASGSSSENNDSEA